MGFLPSAENDSRGNCSMPAQRDFHMQNNHMKTSPLVLALSLASFLSIKRCPRKNSASPGRSVPIDCFDKPERKGEKWKKNATYLTDGVDVDVVLGVLGVRHERLDQELSQDTIDSLDSLGLASTLLNPSSGLSPGLVQGQKAALASSLDELIGLCDELGARLVQPRVLDLGLVKDVLGGSTLGEVERAELGVRVVVGSSRERGRLDDGSSGKVVVEDGLAIGFEDRLCGHDCEEGTGEEK